MAGFSDEVKKPPVAFLDVYYRASVEDDFLSTSNILDIYPNEDFYFGRSDSCKYACGDPTISNKHLHFRCIIFEEGSSEDGIPPLVYVEDLSTNGTYLTRANAAAKEQRIYRRDGKVLLASGDQLRVSPTLALHFRYSATIIPNSHRLEPSQRRESELFADRYMVTNQLLGSGGHGDVFVAIHKKSDRQLACKIVNMLSYTSDTPERKPFQDVTNTRDGSPIQRQRVQRDRDNILNSPQFREFDILKDLDHANIVHLEKVFWSSSTIFIFQELVTGGDLFSYIEYNGGKLSDADSALILLQILKGVEYMHDRDIVHRDLKPDNILVSTSTDTPLRVVITDFGSCRRVETPKSRVIEQQAAKRRMFTIVGTLEYAAPEIYDKGTKVPSKRGYSKAIDMWSIGAVATALLTGDVIFTDRLNPVMRKDPAKVILELSSKCDLSILDNGYSAWRAVGKRPKDFVRKLLVVDESKRLDIKQALAHDWFTNKYCEDSFKAIYEKAISAWQPRRISFRVVEALDLHRLKHSPTKKDNDDPGHSRFFRPLSVPFPQGEMYARNIASPTNTAHGMLPTIGEEVTPEPETPGHGSPEVPIAPKGKKLGRAATSFDVQYSLSQLDLAAGVPATSASTDITMTDHEQQNESESLDLDAPVANTKRLRSASLLTPVHELLEVENDDDVDEAVQETPPMQRKRPREADPDKDETCDSSLELIAERSIQMAAANVTKKMKARW